MTSYIYTDANGSHNASDFQFALTNGVNHSRGTIIIPSKTLLTFAEDCSVTVTQDFTNKASTIQTFSELKVISSDPVQDSEGKWIHTVKLACKRWRWETTPGTVNWFANVYDKNGKRDWRSEDATWKALVLRCLAVWGETGNILDAGSIPDNPITPRNSIAADTPAIDALHDLLRAARYMLGVRSDGKISITEIGTGDAPVISASYLRPLRTGVQYANQPDSILVSGAPYIIDDERELEACAIDVDGNVKALENISYLNASGLPVEELLGAGFRQLTDLKVRDLAKRSVGRLWRLKNTGKYVDDFTKPSFSTYSPFNLPILRHRGEKDEKNNFLPAVLNGAWFEKGDTEEDRKRYKNIGTADEGVDYNGGLQIADAERGLIHTSHILGVLDNVEIDHFPARKDDEIVKVTLVPPTLKFAYLSLPNELWQQWYLNSSGTAVEASGQSGDYAVIRRTDFQMAGDGAKFDPKAENEYKARAQELAQQLIDERAQKSTEGGEAAGVHLITPNGTVWSVNYACTPIGCVTTWHRNLGTAVKGDLSPSAKSFNMDAVSTNPRGGEILAPSPAAKVSGGFGAVGGDGGGGASAFSITGLIEELRLVNCNEVGIVPIRESDVELGIAVALTGLPGGHDDHDLYGEVWRRSGLDEGSVPEMKNIGPLERHNMRFIDHTPDFQARDLPPDIRSIGQLAPWQLQLIIDDSHRRFHNINRSTPVMRFSSKGLEGVGYTYNLWRVRAVPLAKGNQYALDWEDHNDLLTITPTPNFGFELMNYFGPGIQKLQEGGWCGQGAGARDQGAIELLERQRTPTMNLGQWIDLFEIPDDDISLITKDGDGVSLINHRARAHWMYESDPNFDGSIAFDTDDPGDKGLTFIWGFMRLEPSLANTWGWGRETGKWVPSVGVPGIYWYPIDPLEPVPGSWGFTTDVSFYDAVAVNGGTTLFQYLIGRIAGDDAFSFIIPDEGDHRFGWYTQDVDSPYTSRTSIMHLDTSGGLNVTKSEHLDGTQLIRSEGSTVDPTSSSTTYVLIPEMTATMVLTGAHDVSIQFQASVENSGGAPITLTIALFIDGTIRTNSQLIENVAISNNEESIGLNWSENLAAGSRTIEIRWKVDVGTIQAISTFRALSVTEHK